MLDVLLFVNLQTAQVCAVDLDTSHQLQCYPAVLGKDSTPTPQGNFELDKLVINPQYVSCQTGVNYGVGFLGELAIVTNIDTSQPGCTFAIHGTPENQEYLLGTKASAGCVRMRNKDLKHFLSNYNPVIGYSL